MITSVILDCRYYWKSRTKRPAVTAAAQHRFDSSHKYDRMKKELSAEAGGQLSGTLLHVRAAVHSRGSGRLGLSCSPLHPRHLALMPGMKFTFSEYLLKE